MSKLLFWIVIILVALVVARLLAQKASRGAPPTPSSRHQHPPGTRPGATSTGTELMVRCAHCGIQLPTDEAVRRKGYNYCGLAHSLRGPKT